MKLYLLALIATFNFFAYYTTACAEEHTTPATAPDKAAKECHTEDIQKQTKHSVKIGNQKIDYTATAGTLVLRDDKDNTPRASIFYVAYTKDGADAKNRPVTFAFNGGPGCSAVWLHLGALGPRRVVVNTDYQPTLSPAKIVDNDLSILDDTDLVFIDPISTGFSRVPAKCDEQHFHAVGTDVTSVGDFIQLYLSRNGRWSSPKFLIGESYGSIRAVALASYFFEHYFVAFNGLILVSPALRYDAIDYNKGNVIPFMLDIPTLTAAGFYHKKLAPEYMKSLEHALAESKKFALGEYATTLLQGSASDKDVLEKTATKMSALTGLPKDYILRNRLKISVDDVVIELLKSQEKEIGRFDVRYSSYLTDIRSYYFSHIDPSLAYITPAFSSAIQAYLADELDFKSDLMYETLNLNVHPWGFKNFENRYLNIADDLQYLMVTYPKTKVLCCVGLYDAATPFFTTEFTLNQLNYDRANASKIDVVQFESGHMIYLDKNAAPKFKSTLNQFIKSSLPN